MIKLAEITEDELPGGFDPLRAIGISRARMLLRGKGSDPQPPSREALRRWIVQGCRPGGPGTPLLRLQAIRLNNEFLLMPDWVHQFEAERIRLATRNPLADEVPNRSREAAKRRADKILDAAGIGTPKCRERS